MRFTVNQLMTKIASTVNQEASAPSAGSSEWNLWLEYLNRGIQEWADANDWESLRKTYVPSITGASQATVTLPLDYRKIAGPPRLHKYGDVEGGTEYPYISQEKKGLYISTDEYVTEGGDISTGHHLLFHPMTLSSGASIEIPYFSMPTSLASPADVPAVNDSQFLIDRTVAYIFEARSDPRFQQEEVKARDRLLQMIENANLAKYNSYATPDPVQNTLRKSGFRIGRD